VQFYPDVASKKDKLRLGSSLSRNFLLDAEDFWIENDPGSELKSGLWSEIDRSTNAILKPQQFVWKQENIIDFVVKIAYNENNQLYNTQTSLVITIS